MATIRMSSLGEDGDGIPDASEGDNGVKEGGTEGGETMNQGQQQEGEGLRVVQSKPVSSSPSQSVVDQVMGTFSSLNPQEQHQTIVVLILTLAQQVGRLPQLPSAVRFGLPFLFRFQSKAWSTATAYSNSYQKMAPDEKLQTVTLMLSTMIEQIRMVSSRELTCPASDDSNEGGIPLGVRGWDQSEPHVSLPRLTEYFEKTLVEFAQELDGRGGGEGVREKVVKEMVGVYDGACSLLAALCFVFSEREDPEVASAVQLIWEKYAVNGEQDHTSLSTDLLPELVRQFHCSHALYSHTHQLSPTHWELLSTVVSLKGLMLQMDPAAKQTLTRYISKHTARQLTFLLAPPHSVPKEHVSQFAAATCTVLTDMLVTAPCPIVPRIDQSDFNSNHMVPAGAVVDGHVTRYLSPVLFTCKSGMVAVVMKGTVDVEVHTQ